MPLRFRKEVVSVRVSPPGSRGETVVRGVEFRQDPLTGRWCRVSLERARRPRQVSGDAAILREAAERTRDTCPFCPERIEVLTPTFTDLPYRRLRRGNSWVFPNLYPFARHHAVTVFTVDHFKLPTELSLAELEEGIHAALSFIRDVRSVDPASRYPVIAWNNLPPSGASIIHPHLQVIVDDRPPGLTALEIEASRRYSEGGRSYWWELLEEDRERMIKEAGGVAWIAEFAPHGSHCVLAVFRDRSSITDLSQGEVRAFADGLLRVLRYYGMEGIVSFNMVFYSGPVDEDVSRYFSLHARIVARPVPSPLYVNDDGFLEKLFSEPVIDTCPESLAEALRGFF